MVNRRTVRGCLACVACATVVALATAVAATGAPLKGAPIQVGTGRAGSIGFEFVGRVDQDGANFTLYGYLTHVQGLADGSLFTDPSPLNHGEQTARFTFSGTGTFTSRSVLQNLTVLNVSGQLTFYVNPQGGASFDTPNSFRSGAAVGTVAARFQDVINVQSPNQAVATAVAELVQQNAGTFVLGGKSYRFGQKGLSERLSATGEGTRTDATIPRSFILVAGDTVIGG